MGQLLSENNDSHHGEQRHGIVLPTDELRQALHQALTTEKSRELSAEDLQQVDATVSKYLHQQLRLNALRAQEETPATPSAAMPWLRTWWFQVGTGVTVCLLGSVWYWH